MTNAQLILRFPGLKRSTASELADSVGAEATVLRDEAGPVGGYGDVGTKTVAVIITNRSLRAVARWLGARQHTHDEIVRVAVQIEDPDGTRLEQTLAYATAPGQSTVQAATSALRALPGVGEAIERSIW